MVIENVKGNYRFIRGGGPFSSGCAAQPGFAIVHAAIRPFATLTQGFDLVERHLKEKHRPIDALCGMHLRIPQPLTLKGFEEFNRPYIERLKSWGLETEGANPVARTNVALAVSRFPRRCWRASITPNLQTARRIGAAVLSYFRARRRCVLAKAANVNWSQRATFQPTASGASSNA